MNKTTTRLATVGVIIVLGAFAIALAQHDSRNREDDAVVTNEFASQAVEPIPLEGDWNGEHSIVRGNNDELPEHASFSLPTEGELVQGNPLRQSDHEMTASTQVQPASFESLPDEFAGEYMGATDIESSEVIAVAAQEPLPGPQASSLVELPSRVGSPPNPNLPSGSGASGGAGFASALPELPVAGGGTSPVALPSFPMGGSGVPGNPIAASPALPSMPTLPTENQSTTSSASQQPRGIGGLNSMSDTQRGAMTPTNLSNPEAPSALAESLPPAGANYNAGAATWPSQGSNTAGSQRGLTNSMANQNPQPVGTSPVENRLSARTAASPTASAALASLVSNQPGSRYLDGSQNPIMMIQKRAPDEIQVGKKAIFVITVRNAGNAVAHDVTVVDLVPQGVKFVEATPNETPNANGLITWKLGEMAAGDEKTISLQVIPEVQGEIGSVASVHFAAQASVRTIATLPKVEVSIEAQPDVLIGGSQEINVTIRNSGTGVARNVRLEADIPPQLRHESGEAMLEAVIGDLRPNEVKRLGLIASAIQPGRAQCVVRAVDEDGVQAEQSAPIDVRAPQLVASLEGPTLRYLERQATYRIQVQNTGTAAATKLHFLAHLPAGLKFVSTDNQHSTYDPNNNTVSLGLEELAANQVASISLTVLPVELGPQMVKFNVSGDLGVAAEAKAQVVVDGLAELAFTIGQDNGTVEVGATSTYSVQVTNVGNKPDKQVQLMVQLPNGAELVPGGVNAPVEWQAEGNKIVFAAIPEMRNRDQQTFRFQVRHNQAGNQVVRTQLTSTNWPVAVVKEEGTLVYNDQN